MQFLAKYGKTYVSKDDISSRFNTFSDNLDRINEHNKGDSYKMGINEFSDMTIEEFESVYA